MQSELRNECCHNLCQRLSHIQQGYDARHQRHNGGTDVGNKVGKECQQAPSSRELQSNEGQRRSIGYSHDCRDEGLQLEVGLHRPEDTSHRGREVPLRRRVQQKEREDGSQHELRYEIHAVRCHLLEQQSQEIQHNTSHVLHIHIELFLKSKMYKHCLSLLLSLLRTGFIKLEISDDCLHAEPNDVAHRPEHSTSKNKRPNDGYNRKEALHWLSQLHPGRAHAVINRLQLAATRAKAQPLHEQQQCAFATSLREILDRLQNANKE
mmetsp:Transcript_65872/g.157469  ORF Transcript_65872/g.157469 Transcript_65872/m.157469 type:complete len:265 (+) Transcript_65872:686-1480(+)